MVGKPVLAKKGPRYARGGKKCRRKKGLISAHHRRPTKPVREKLKVLLGNSKTPKVRRLQEPAN
jgi:hypothetical protein